MQGVGAGGFVLLAFYGIAWCWFDRDPERGIPLPRYAPPHEVGGEDRIRTYGTLRFNGFQDRRFQPLSHLSRVGENTRYWRPCHVRF